MSWVINLLQSGHMYHRQTAWSVGYACTHGDTPECVKQDFLLDVADSCTQCLAVARNH